MGASGVAYWDIHATPEVSLAMKKPTFSFLKMAPNSLMTAPTIEKVGRHDFKNGRRNCRKKIVGARKGLCCFYLVTLHTWDEAPWLLAATSHYPMATDITHQTINSIRI